MTGSSLKIGTRGSPLALTQAHMVEAKLLAAHPGLSIEMVIIKTSGDWKPEDGETRLAEEQGGKGLFARELEHALIAGTIDCAVHSMKDMESFLPDGLALDHVLERENPQDAFICHTAKHFKDLPQGATIGTSSMRRQAFLLEQRPDLQVVPLRGNVQTRLDKLKSGQVDATFLAMAGLNRLGISGDFIHPMGIEDILPACGQGIVGIETRVDDDRVRSLLETIHHAPTGLCASMERAALQALDGSCRTPIGAYARLDGNAMSFDLKVASEDGARVYKIAGRSDITTTSQAAAFGADRARQLKTKMPDDLFE